MEAVLLGLSVLPVVVLMIYIYRKDKYEKEPVGQLTKAFFGGVLSVPIAILFVYFINTVWTSNTVFHQAFIQAGFAEELSKLIVLFLFIWRNRNFNEYMDGIVYAVFVGLGFACVENIIYVFSSGSESLASGVSTGIIRALLSVPAHFLFAVIMGYFFALAKFEKRQRLIHFACMLVCPTVAHGLFDWLLMFGSELNAIFTVGLYMLFIVFDVYLWRLGLRFISCHQDFSRLSAEKTRASFDNLNPLNNEPEYKSIDWHAGDRKD